MFKRLVFGVAKGCLVAAIVVAALRFLSSAWSSVAVVYGATVAVGVLTGLVAGKPFWRRGNKVESAIKTLVGAFIASTVMFGIRKWMPHVTVDLGGFGHGPLGAIPAAALPLVASALALVFEIDDAFGPDPSPAPRHRVAASDAPPSADSVDRSSARSRHAGREP